MKLSVSRLMRWLMIVMVLLSVIAPTATSIGSAPVAVSAANSGPEHVAQRILLKVQPGLDAPTGQLAYAAPTALARDLMAQGVTTAQALFHVASGTSSAIGLERIYRLELAASTDVTRTVAALNANPFIEWAEPDYIARAITIPNDPLYTEQWGLSAIAAPDAWDVITGTQPGALPTIIAVIDSGIDLTHPDLQANLWTNAGEIPGNGIDDDNNGYVDDVRGWNFVNGTNNVYDGNGHGTQVAGVAAAATNNGVGIAGVCWNCKIMPVRVMADSGISNYSDIALGVRYAADKGAHVINLSLGGYAYSNALREAINYAVNEKNVVVVAGAGNDNISTPFYPAAYDNVLAVAGTMATDTKAEFSDYGTWVDLSAPAVEIMTTYLGGDWGPANGTSLSAPFVAGIAALIRSQRPDWSAALVRNQLLQTADNIDALNPSYAGKLGAGRVNAAQATQDPYPIITLVDTTINNDPLGRPTPGETATLAVTLRNDWWDATGVTGTLTTADTLVTVGQATAGYGDLASGVSGVSSPVYTFTVEAGAGYNYPIPFTLAVSANDGAFTTVIPFTITTRSGDEHFCGTVAEDMVWTNDKTYILDCNVGIAPGYTLTIQAGTEVHFNGDYSLNVGGALVADGTASQPIRFMPHTGGSWGRIFFDDPSIDAQATSDGVYQSGNLLRHVRIEGATQGIGCTNATPFLEHMTLTSGGMNCASGDTAVWVKDSDLSGNVQVSEGSGVDSVTGVWVARTPMPTARYGLAVATASNGKLYAIGGGSEEEATEYLATVEEYNPATDTWSARTPMPTARCCLGAVVASNGKIYVIGGENDGTTLATVEEYNPATDTWITRTPMPTARNRLGVAAAPNGKLYAIGGINRDLGILTTVEEYDPTTNAWTTCTPMSTERYGLAVMTAPDGKIYAVGGSGRVENLASVEAYDPTTDIWMPRTSMLTVRGMLAGAVATNDKLYAIGGHNHWGGALAVVEEYDPSMNLWVSRVSMPTARSGLAVAVASEGNLYAIGGLNWDIGGGFLTTVEKFSPPTDEYGYNILRSTLYGDLSLPDYSKVQASEVRGNITVGGYLAEDTRNLIQTTTVIGNISINGTAYGVVVDCVVNGSINLSSGIAENNTVNGNITVNGPALNNTVRNGGINVGWGGAARDNSIENAPGWSIQASGNNTTIQYNRIVGCANGIQASGGVVKGNLIANIIGIGLQIGSATVEHNTFTGIGGSAIRITSGIPGLIVGNNFEFNTGTYDVENLIPKTTVMTVDARNNWWGTTNGTAIRQRIWDFNDDYNLGTVLYAPVLTAPDTTAPAYVRAITLTPESPVGIQTVVFDVEFSREMDAEVAPQAAFVNSMLDVWAVRAPMPTPRTGLAVAVAPNGKLYAIGGESEVATVEEYNPATDSWQSRAPMPTGRGYLAAAAALNGKLYAIGGEGQGGYLATMEEYDPLMDAWTPRTPMPTARAGLSAVVAPNGKLYAIGGFNGDHLATVEEYDPATDTWTVRTPMPTARWGAATAIAPNGRLYTIGGLTPTVEEYDPMMDSWQIRTLMPTHRDFLAVATAPNGRIYVIGGSNLAMMEEYDPAMDSWRTCAPMSIARTALAAAAAPNGKIYVIGGSNLAIVEELTPWVAYTEFYGGFWPAPNLYRATYDFSTLIPRGVYTLTVSGARTPEYTGSGTGLLPIPGGGMEIAPNSAYTFTVDYAGYINDTTASPAPAVTACAAATSDTLSAVWSAYDPESAIDRYQYAIGVAPGSAEVVNWTVTPLTETTRVSLTLVAGQTYYFSVKARNEAGLWSEAGSAGVVAGSDTCVSTEPAPEVNFVGAPRSGDAPLTVQFTSTVTNAVTSYAWTFGDGSIANTPNPTHTYQSAGSFGVTLMVTGPGGTAQAVKSGYIIVNPPSSVPMATFSADVVSGIAPLTVTFTAVTEGVVEGWHWDFGDGGIAITGPVVSHTYNASGVFDVSLTVTNTSGSYTASELDYITVTETPIPAPEVDFVGAPRNGDAPLTVLFTSTVTNAVTSYAWTFGDGGTAATANPTHTYASAGSFGVSLVVTGPGGIAQKTRPAYITVNPPPNVPTATFSADIRSGDAPLTVIFTAVTEGMVENWRWDFGDGGIAITGPVVSHTYTTPGMFNVSLIVSNTNGSYIASEPDYITVTEAPILVPEVDFVGAPRSGNAPLTVQFTSTVTNTVTSYAWTFGDGETAATVNPTHTYTSAGSYSVRLIVTGPGGTAQVIKSGYITVNPSPGVPTAVFYADVVRGDVPLTVTFTAIISGTVESWHWDFGDNTTASTGPVVQHTYQMPGVFGVSLTVSNTHGRYTINEPAYITVSSGGHRVYLPLVLRN